jgi:hypothetical protein
VDEIWTVLEGIDYPVSKDALVATATGVGARDDLLHRLSLLPEKTFGDAEQLGRALSRTRAASNPALVAITAEPCPDCGFPMPHGQPHSCIEEKARFAESVHAVTDDFETLDEGREPPA